MSKESEAFLQLAEQVNKLADNFERMCVIVDKLNDRIEKLKLHAYTAKNEKKKWYR